MSLARRPPLLFGPVVLPRLARCSHIELAVFLLFLFCGECDGGHVSEGARQTCAAADEEDYRAWPPRDGRGAGWRPLVGWRLIGRRASSEKKGARSFGKLAPVSSRHGIWNTLSALAAFVCEPVSACSGGQSKTVWEGQKTVNGPRTSSPTSPGQRTLSPKSLGRSRAPSAGILDIVTLSSRFPCSRRLCRLGPKVSEAALSLSVSPNFLHSTPQLGVGLLRHRWGCSASTQSDTRSGASIATHQPCTP